jgi:DNA polymerase V
MATPEPRPAGPAQELAPLHLPWVEGYVRCGFASPADDFAVRRCDLNELLITHPMATFFWRARGQSMAGAGIGDGDILVVDRALDAVPGDVVVAEVDQDFTVKYLRKRGARLRLCAADPTFPDIVPTDARTVVICGVVTAIVKRLRGG